MDYEQVARQQRIAVIKRQIEDGTYETPARLDAALEAFLDDASQGCLTPGSDRPASGPTRPR